MGKAHQLWELSCVLNWTLVCQPKLKFFSEIHKGDVVPFGKVKALKLDLLPAKFCCFSKILTLLRCFLEGSGGHECEWQLGNESGEKMERDTSFCCSYERGWAAFLSLEGRGKGFSLSRAGKAACLVSVVIIFLENFWNEFQHKSICFSFIATFNTYTRKQYRKVRWV